MLDQFDHKILTALQREGNITNAKLADQVYLSPSQCSRRRIRLEKEGYILGYHAELNFTRLGLPIEAIIRISLNVHHDQTIDELIEFFNQQNEIQQACAITGNADFILIIRVVSLDALSEFIHRRLLRHSAITQVRSDIVLNKTKI